LVSTNDTIGKAKSVSGRRELTLARRPITDAWLANYDVAGTDHNNIIVDYDNHAHRIDNGGGLRYRAAGNLKEHFGDEVPELEQLQDVKFNKWAAKLFKNVEVGKADDPSYATPLRVAHVPDTIIRDLVARYGPADGQDELADKIIARRDNVAKAYEHRAAFTGPFP
jgi:hypothetical protein